MTPKEVEDVVGRLEDEAMRLSARSIDHGCVDSGIASNLASEAASLLRTQAERIAYLERQNGPDMWCLSCGTVTRDGECDCNRFGEVIAEQKLVNLADELGRIGREALNEKDALTAQLSTAQATIERYREALEPIIQAYDECSGAEPSLSVLYRHIDRARSVLEGKE